MSDISNDFVIGDDNWHLHIDPVVNGSRVMKGLIPRDYTKNPVGSYSSSPAWSLDDMPLVPWEELPERIKEMEANKSRISDMYDVGDNGAPIPSLDQNGQGYCWSYSTAACIQALRCIANMPYEQLSAHSVACMVKNFQDQGGWGAMSMEYATSHGYVPTRLWPAKSMNRKYNTPENWQAALEFRVTEGWVDLHPAVYDRSMNAQQVLTCLVNRKPVIADYNFWGHSVALFDPVDAYPNRRFNDPMRYGTRHKNSWTDAYGVRGYGVLKDSKAFPNGGASPRATWGT